MKIIYDHKVSYSKALEICGLERLDDRRLEIIKKFVAKLSSNNRFERWFPPHPLPSYGLRNTRTYQELHANTDRLYRSPLFTYQRMLNEV